MIAVNLDVQPLDILYPSLFLLELLRIYARYTVEGDWRVALATMEGLCRRQSP